MASFCLKNIFSCFRVTHYLSWSEPEKVTECRCWRRRGVAAGRLWGPILTFWCPMSSRLLHGAEMWTLKQLILGNYYSYYRKYTERCAGEMESATEQRRHYSVLDLIQQRILRLFGHICCTKDQRLVKTVMLGIYLSIYISIFIRPIINKQFAIQLNIQYDRTVRPKYWTLP